MSEGEQPVSELPEKGADAAKHFADLYREARRVQRERGFSTKAGEDEEGTGEGTADAGG